MLISITTWYFLFLIHNIHYNIHIHFLWLLSSHEIASLKIIRKPPAKVECFLEVCIDALFQRNYVVKWFSNVHARRWVSKMHGAISTILDIFIVWGTCFAYVEFWRINATFRLHFELSLYLPLSNSQTSIGSFNDPRQADRKGVSSIYLRFKTVQQPGLIISSIEKAIIIE